MVNLDDHTAKHCILSIRLAPDGFSFFVLNEKEQRLLNFEQHESQVHQDAIAIAIDVLSKRGFEDRPFHQVNVLLDFPEVSCVPFALYDEEQKDQAFSFNHDLASREFVINNHNDAYGLEVLYPIPQNVYEYFGKHYKDFRFVHRLHLLLHQANIYEAKAQEQLFIAYSKHHFTAVGIRNHGLIYHNTFALNCEEDLIYYLLLVFQELKFDQYSASVLIDGALALDHPSIKVIKEYVQQVDFLSSEALKSPTFGIVEEEKHYHTALFELSQCE